MSDNRSTNFTESDSVSTARQHSSRMHTTHLKTVRPSVSVATTRCHSMEGGVSSQKNKFEQVSNDHHQMSLAGEGVGPQG